MMLLPPPEIIQLELEEIEADRPRMCVLPLAAIAALLSCVLVWVLVL